VLAVVAALRQNGDVKLQCSTCQQINVGSNSPVRLIVDAELLKELEAGYKELHGGTGRVS
jgi:hypothetical protein